MNDDGDDEDKGKTFLPFATTFLLFFGGIHFFLYALHNRIVSLRLQQQQAHATSPTKIDFASLLQMRKCSFTFFANWVEFSCPPFVLYLCHVARLCMHPLPLSVCCCVIFRAFDDDKSMIFSFRRYLFYVLFVPYCIYRKFIQLTLIE